MFLSKRTKYEKILSVFGFGRHFFLKIRWKKLAKMGIVFYIFEHMIF